MNLDAGGSKPVEVTASIAIASVAGMLAGYFDRKSQTLIARTQPIDWLVEVVVDHLISARGGAPYSSDALGSGYT